MFKQKAAYEMRISDWSSDVCSSDLASHDLRRRKLARTARSQQSSQAQRRSNRRPARLAIGPLAGSVTSVSYPFGREFSCDFHILREIDFRRFQPSDRQRADLPFPGEQIDSPKLPTSHPLWRAPHLFHLLPEKRRAFPTKARHPDGPRQAETHPPPFTNRHD